MLYRFLQPLKHSLYLFPRLTQVPLNLLLVLEPYLLPKRLSQPRLNLTFPSLRSQILTFALFSVHRPDQIALDLSLLAFLPLLGLGQ